MTDGFTIDSWMHTNHTELCFKTWLSECERWAAMFKQAAAAGVNENAIRAAYKLAAPRRLKRTPPPREIAGIIAKGHG